MQKQIILASKSPRRKELLESIGLKFIIESPVDFIEISSDTCKAAHEIVKINAKGKAKAVANKQKDAIIIGVDTVGAYHDHILEKPKDYDDAFRMLRLLSGNTHEVLSAICIIDSSTGKTVEATEVTHITFVKMSDNDIHSYLKTDEYKDKAAAYAAQGIGSLFVKGFDGDYFNVVGLPIYRLNIMLKEFDLSLIDIVNCR